MDVRTLTKQSWKCIRRSPAATVRSLAMACRTAAVTAASASGQLSSYKSRLSASPHLSATAASTNNNTRRRRTASADAAGAAIAVQAGRCGLWTNLLWWMKIEEL